MKYLIKNLYYSNDKNPTLYLMEEVNGTIKYKNVFTNIYYPTNQINVIGNLLSIIKSNNLELIITDIHGKIDYYADIDKLNFILKVLTAQKSLPKNVEMKFKSIGNQVAEHVTNLSGLNPTEGNIAIKASQRDTFKNSLSSSAATSLSLNGHVTVTAISPLFLMALHTANIKGNFKTNEAKNLTNNFTVIADVNGIKQAMKNIKPELENDDEFKNGNKLQFLLRKQN